METTYKSGRPIQILLVEDNIADASLVLKYLKGCSVPNQVTVVRDGEEALDFLKKRWLYADLKAAPRPDLILLDLKMPKISGLDVLRWIRLQPDLRVLRIIVFSSSNYPSDINSAHALRISAYLVKPGRLDEWVALVDALKTSWLGGS